MHTLSWDSSIQYILFSLTLILSFLSLSLSLATSLSSALSGLHRNALGYHVNTHAPITLSAGVKPLLIKPPSSLSCITVGCQWDNDSMNAEAPRSQLHLGRGPLMPQSEARNSGGAFWCNQTVTRTCSGHCSPLESDCLCTGNASCHSHPNRMEVSPRSDTLLR